MATVTLEYDGRSAAMQKLIDLFITLGGKVTEQSSPKAKKNGLDEAIDDFKNGRTTKCRDFNDYLEKINA